MAKELRPYYDPDTFDAGYLVSYKPGIGVLNSSGIPIIDSIFSDDTKAATVKFGIRNRHILERESTNLDIWSGTSEALGALVRKVIRAYFKVIVNQPFDAVRLLLEVGSFNIGNLKIKSPKPKAKVKSYLDLENSESAEFFFTDGDSSRTHDRISDAEEQDEEEEEAEEEEEKVAINENHIQPLSFHTVDVMLAILSKEGFISLWKATNITYIHQGLTLTLESWFTGFLSPFLEIPDPYYIDINYSPEPLTSLWLILFASITTGLVLAPLDLIRTKLIISRNSSNLKRSLRENIKQLTSYFCPVQLFFPTVLNSFITNLGKNLLPIIFMNNFKVDSSSAYYEMLKILTELVELFLKLPIETILRRAQTSYLINVKQNIASGDSNGLEITKDDLIVEFSGYTGVFDTIFSAIYSRPRGGDPHTGKTRVISLYQGWRMGVLTIFARWGFRMTNYNDLQFLEERF